ncbi:tripartite tricarboxylate transporter TctB family protein [Roseomonas sp. AR75]|uniref:tripartite tricarboxylate transporter TctB family protein n=1 Tax=Roseomonas sp. AR75 TaxID=2562311 RepID=UPI001485BDC9|nr:tripartite tricarboxylate transporter TctB family protein [Roseomonas sp. AR75]
MTAPQAPEEEAESPFSGDRAPLPPRWDLITAAVLLAFGLGVIALAWRMPTFVEQSQTGLTAPGIVPGFHATIISLLAILLGLRAIRRGALAAQPARAKRAGGDTRRLFTAAALGTLYAGFLVGRLPFWMATALFVFAFTAVFEWERGPKGRPRRLAEAALIGLGTGLAVLYVFERIFLVRLP